MVIQSLIQTLLVLALVLMLLSLLSGYPGYLPTHFGYGGDGLGIAILVGLLVLLFR